jgi:hypothetical protein
MKFNKAPAGENGVTEWILMTAAKKPFYLKIRI